jgi:hypothetical protein
MLAIRWTVQSGTSSDAQGRFQRKEHISLKSLSQFGVVRNANAKFAEMRGRIGLPTDSVWCPNCVGWTLWRQDDSITRGHLEIFQEALDPFLLSEF